MIRFLKVYDSANEDYIYINVKRIKYFYENLRDKYNPTNKLLTVIHLLDYSYKCYTEYDCETLSRILNEKE